MKYEFTGTTKYLLFLFSFRVELANDRNDTYITALRENISPNVQMILCVCPTNRKDRYDAIKKTCCIDHPSKCMDF